VGRYLPGDIDPWLCTHLVYAFAVVNYANEITENEWKEHTLYRQFNELKNRYANCSWWTIQHTLQNINICFTNK
jgi:GH18 family chitinase